MTLFSIIKMTNFLIGLVHVFQKDSNVVKYALFGYYINKLYLLEVLIIAYLVEE
jgi:hypothetical protein